MEAIPAVDPIPLPAPVWLFVALHSLTMVLHFLAVQWLVGGLVLTTVWSLAGRFRGSDRLTRASRAVGRPLPIVMTYVINLGVPPLLFTQVLYGRALYTSSILIGVWWISVIVLLMAAYSLLYVMLRQADRGRTAGWVSLGALLVVLMIAMIYSTNMTLMLHPDQWRAIYRAAPHGTTFHSGDPTVLPRWLYMMVGSVGMTGVGLMLLGLKKSLDDDVKALFARWSGRLVATFAVIQIALGLWVWFVQPATVRATFAEGGFRLAFSVGWALTALGLAALGVLAARRPAFGRSLAWGAAAVAFLNVAAMVLVRDGIRNASLLQAGFDAWGRQVGTNWSTVILFLACFVAALGVVAWLVSVTARAKHSTGEYV